MARLLGMGLAWVLSPSKSKLVHGLLCIMLGAALASLGVPRSPGGCDHALGWAYR